ncbi:MAG TPA: LON peptidase substrate-binding domain-containing protein [Candidatus Dormibacteraeota bacterium]|nr:LON peptidase substrate-binding domain-containing protein [Candidatus Dormibacteraeota bacterium]
MSELALFPLRVVLYPHLPLPLHVFEPRYQALVRDCQKTGGRFGVVAIRSGEEVGGSAEPEGIGTVAIISKLRPLAEGRTHLVVTGAHRFRINELLNGKPYPRAEVELLEDQAPEPAAFILASEARSELSRYTAGLARITGRTPSAHPLPTDPLLLSWVVAATLMVDLAHKQRLLEQTSVSQRLRQEIELLKRESTLLDLKLANLLRLVPTYGRN